MDQSLSQGGGNDCDNKDGIRGDGDCGNDCVGQADKSQECSGSTEQ